jgi:hypothetical protein
MAKADSVHSTPPINTSAIDDLQSPTKPPGDPQDAPLYIPTDVTPEELFQAIGRLRKEARDEIDRLIGFLDQTDDYVSRELEDPADEEPSLGWPEQMTGTRPSNCGDIDDLELDDSDDEPSLGSGAVYANSSQSQWSQPGGGTDDREEDAGDDREEENEHCDGHAEYEPSLGWTVDGVIQNTSAVKCDAELQDHFSVAPQNRTEIEGPQISAESSYRKFLCGLTDEQKKVFCERMNEQWGTTGVIIR